MDVLAPRKIIPVSEFDMGDGDVNNANLGLPVPLQRLRSAEAESKSDTGQLLILCLVERMCQMQDRDPDHNRKLLSLICSRLHNMGIISDCTLRIPVEVRRNYSEAFNRLWDMATDAVHSKGFTLGNNSTCSVITSRSDTCPLPGPSLNVADLFHNSRFAEEFFIEGRLGSGAFGSVLKVRNKLDNNIYAIKKIKLRRLSSDSKVLREVTTLAKLDHPNVIRYHSAWLEYSRFPSDTLCGPNCRHNSSSSFNRLPPQQKYSPNAIISEMTSPIFQRSNVVATTGTGGACDVGIGLKARVASASLLSLSSTTTTTTTTSATSGFASLPPRPSANRIAVRRKKNILSQSDDGNSGGGDGFSRSNTAIPRTLSTDIEDDDEGEVEEEDDEDDDIIFVDTPIESTPASNGMIEAMSSLRVASTNSSSSGSIAILRHPNNNNNDESVNSNPHTNPNHSNDNCDCDKSIDLVAAASASASASTSNTGMSSSHTSNISIIHVPSSSSSSPSSSSSSSSSSTATPSPPSSPSTASSSNSNSNNNNHANANNIESNNMLNDVLRPSGVGSEFGTGFTGHHIEDSVAAASVVSVSHTSGYSIDESNTNAFYDDASSEYDARTKGDAMGTGAPGATPVGAGKGKAQTQCTCDGTLVTLYIQMQLCEYALHDWLRVRDTSSPQVLYAEAMHIFHQVVLGVAYIHSLKLVHRDIKPQNIFLRTSVGSRPVVKIGDFGLAREASEIVYMQSNFMSSSTHSSSSDQHTSGVGTSTYAAPEQTRGGVLSEKSDIFSLGLLLFELLYVFGTSMERYALFDNLRKGMLPDTLVKQFPKESAFILWMTAARPNDRPSAVDILHGESGLFDQVILQQNHVLHLEQRLATAETALRTQSLELERLRRLLRDNKIVP